MTGIVISPFCGNEQEWDQFAQNCNASFQCGYRAAKIWKMRFCLFSHLKRVEIFSRSSDRLIKIGQCAVYISFRLIKFADCLQLIADYRVLWQDVMHALIENFGSGYYSYGSSWNIEPTREADLINIKGVSIRDISRFNIYYIEFSKWATWDKYYQSTSGNIRRNIKNANKYYPKSKFYIIEGFNLSSIFNIAIGRSKLFMRKGLYQGIVKFLLNIIMFSFIDIIRIRIFNYRQFFAFAEERSATLSGYCGIDFGLSHYYLSGFTEQHNHGLGWKLLYKLIQRAWERSDGRGRFVMGSDDYRWQDEKSWQGLLRSRQQCGASPYPTSMIKFRYKAERRRRKVLSVGQTDRLEA